MLGSIARTIAPAVIAASLIATANAGGSSDSSSQILASADIHAANHQYDAHCILFNAGFSPVTVKAIQIIEGKTGTVLPPQNGACQPGALAPLKSCTLIVSITPDTRYACRAIVFPNASLVRGVLELRDVNDNVIESADLR